MKLLIYPLFWGNVNLNYVFSIFMHAFTIAISGLLSLADKALSNYLI